MKKKITNLIYFFNNNFIKLIIYFCLIQNGDWAKSQSPIPI